MQKFQNQIFLIDTLKKGKQEAFIYLVDHYSARLFAYAVTLTNDEGMAQDILQNVFLRVWENRRKISVKSSLQNYLFKSVHNEFVNLYKKNHSTIVLEEAYFASLKRVTESYQEKTFEKVVERVMKEIQKLPPRCKEVFVLSRKEGLTNIEISEYLNISLKTVEAHITKAFAILRKNLGGKIEVTLFLLFGIDFNDYGIQKSEISLPQRTQKGSL